MYIQTRTNISRHDYTLGIPFSIVHSFPKLFFYSISRTPSLKHSPESPVHTHTHSHTHKKAASSAFPQRRGATPSRNPSGGPLSECPSRFRSVLSFISAPVALKHIVSPSYTSEIFRLPFLFGRPTPRRGFRYYFRRLNPNIAPIEDDFFPRPLSRARRGIYRDTRRDGAAHRDRVSSYRSGGTREAVN